MEMNDPLRREEKKESLDPSRTLLSRTSMQSVPSEGALPAPREEA